jgi:hypothetical protein
MVTMLLSASAPSMAMAEPERAPLRYITPGLSISFKLCCGPQRQTIGYGPTLNYSHWVSNDATVGGYGWIHYYPGLSATRLGAGAQASMTGFPFAGIEAGPSVYFDASSTRPALSVTPFSSLGVLWAGVRLNFGVRQKVFAECVIGAGYPVKLSGSLPEHDFRFNIDNTGGRPIRIRGERRFAGTRKGHRYGCILHPHVLSSKAARRALRARWKREAECEFSSIVAFEFLALRLHYLGAPEDLVQRCLAAARDETKHARMCYGLASAYAGTELGPGLMDLEGLDPHRSLDELVCETVIDGCFHEAVAAAAARKHLSCETDPVVRKVLRAIARDEAEHARLAWRILAWAQRPDAVERGLAHVVAHVPTSETAMQVQKRVAARLREWLATHEMQLAA